MQSSTGPKISSCETKDSKVTFTQNTIKIPVNQRENIQTLK